MSEQPTVQIERIRIFPCVGPSVTFEKPEAFLYHPTQPVYVIRTGHEERHFPLANVSSIVFDHAQPEAPKARARRKAKA